MSRAIWQRFDHLVSRHYGGLSRSLLRALRSLKPNEAELKAALQRRQVERAVDSFPWQSLHTTLKPIAAKVFENAAKGGQRHALKKTDVAGIFDLVNPRAVLAAASQAADLVTAIDAETRQAIRDIIRRGQMGELDIDAQVRLLRQIVGLNRPQANAALNYYLARAEDNPERANDLTERYVDRAIRQRSEMIARTETIRAANSGQQAAWSDAVAKGLIPADSMQVWIASPDACDECAELDGESVPLGQAFSSGDDGPPAHPRCRCALALDTDVMQEA